MCHLPELLPSQWQRERDRWSGVEGKGREGKAEGLMLNEEGRISVHRGIRGREEDIWGI